MKPMPSSDSITIPALRFCSTAAALMPVRLCPQRSLQGMKDCIAR